MNREKRKLEIYVQDILKTVFGDVPLTISVFSKKESTDFMFSKEDFDFICIIEFLDKHIKQEQIQKLSNFIDKQVYIYENVENKIFWYENTSSKYEVNKSTFLSHKLNTETTLPFFLDDYIFNKIGASYSPDFLKFSKNLDHEKKDVIKYLGTYFPRSFAESYLIISNIIDNNFYKNTFTRKDEIYILDVGSGTGGNLSGVLYSICENISQECRLNINITVIDGNEEALKMLEKIILLFRIKYNLNISLNSHYLTFDTITDLYKKSQSFFEADFDLILSSKMINEIISKDNKSYYKFYKNFTEKLSDTGLLLMLDVTTKIKSLEYLPILLNTQSNAYIQNECSQYKTLIPLCCNENDTICNANCFSQNTFFISHSRKSMDISKVSYRVIGKKEFVDNIANTIEEKGNVISWNNDGTPKTLCPYATTHEHYIDSYKV